MGCTDACTTNSYGVRGGLAGAESVFAAGITSGGAVSMSNLTTLAQSMYTTYLTVRSSLSSPSMSLGLPDGTYVEVVSCLYYANRDGGCVAAGGAQPLLLVMVSPSVWPNDARRFHYFVPGPDGAIANTSAPLLVDRTFSYDPTTRPWYVS